MSQLKVPVLIGFGLLVATTASFFAASWWIGQVVHQQLLAYEAQLIARDDVRVNRFEYQPGLLSGQLHYDLVWQPTQDSPAYSLFTELRPEGQGVVLQGALPVKQGPWLGRSVTPTGFGLASADYAIHLPKMARAYLPQYPGQRPLVTIQAYAALNGDLAVRANLVDYRGRLIDPDTQESANLTWEGGQLDIRFRDDLAHMSAESRLDLFDINLVQDGLSFRVDKLRYEHDLARAAPYLWLGGLAAEIEQIRFMEGDEHVTIQNLVVAGDSKVVSDKLDTQMRYEIGQTDLVLDDVAFAFAGASVEMALRNLDWQAYQDLVLAVQDLDKMDEQRVMNAFQRLLDGGPSLHLDDMRVRVTENEHVRASMVLGYQPKVALDWAGFSNLSEALEQNTLFSLQAGITRPLVDRIALELWPFDLDETDIKAQLDISIADMVAQNYLLQNDADLSMTMAIEAGQVKLNGADFLPVSDALALVDLATNLLGWAIAEEEQATHQATLDASGLAGLLNDAASPLYEYLELSADFTPDPTVVPLQAGGDQDVSLLTQLQCLGYVNANRPDVTLDYRAGQFDLSIYVQGGLTDTTLIIRDPNGQWHCNDDYPELALDPAVVFSQPLTGNYAIWVGLHANSTADVELLFSEIGVGQ